MKKPATTQNYLGNQEYVFLNNIEDWIIESETNLILLSVNALETNALSACDNIEDIVVAIIYVGEKKRVNDIIYKTGIITEKLKAKKTEVTKQR